MKKYIYITLVIAIFAIFYNFIYKNEIVEKKYDANQTHRYSGSGQKINAVTISSSVTTEKFNESLTNQKEVANLPPKEAIEYMNSETMKIKSILEAGIVNGGAQSLLKNQSISIEQMPKELQPILYSSLREIKEKGYESATEEDTYIITSLENNIISKSREIKNISFTPSKIQNELYERYSYEGYAFDISARNPNESLPYNSVKRIFRNLDTNGILVIEESTLKNGHNSLVKEFVNSTVDNEEAMYSVRKTPSNKTVNLLTWNGSNYSYTIYQYGDNTSKEELISIANTINKNNND